MVVSFIEYQISRREEGIHNHLVGTGRAVQNEIGFVCIKHPGRMFLGRQGCSFMNEKVPHGRRCRGRRGRYFPHRNHKKYGLPDAF